MKAAEVRGIGLQAIP